MIRTRLGDIVGYTSIGISALCLLLTPAFSPGIVVAAMIGTVGGLMAFALGARRIALVAVAFSLIPLCGLILVEYLYKPASNAYLISAPIVAVIILALCSNRLFQTHRNDSVERVG